ncbi:GIY-YIG nuclease family protein [Burkholderia sp. SCN-KJ]|uniref:GIY-YIG nuclease family protein n=1 Tax=Burkholderia sp. SCN-KJ TaxID=2969248 RepID=UPI00214F96B7|nr:GIY-YIG nuclease family protein [Burkholderia sp. SCN-KJ]MCR4467719.1 GIY-YIG nuclease family protein [Burkholderia sp. SCN-KJ]
MSWFLYLIECADDSVYTGITTDVAARFDEHAAGKGARYTRSRKPRAVLASFPLPDRSIASRAEYWVKRLTAAQKRELAAGLRTLESVLPAVVTVDGEVDTDGLKTGTRRRKKVKKAPQPAEIAMQAAETERPVKEAAKAGSDGKASRSGKTSKSGQSAQARAKTKAAPASKRATNGDAAEAKKAASRSTAAKQDKPAVNSTPKRKAPAAGGKSVAKARAGSASTSPARRGASAGKAGTEAVEAAAPATTERGATSATRSTGSTRAKRTKTSPNAAALPTPARTRKNTTTGAKPRTKQNRAAS